MSELKPCPFCGSPGDVDGGAEIGFYALCESMECFVAVGESHDQQGKQEHFFRTAEEAAAAWNKRAPVQANDHQV